MGANEEMLLLKAEHVKISFGNVQALKEGLELLVRGLDQGKEQMEKINYKQIRK